MKPVGYLVNYPGCLEGERGLYYDYILAANGLFAEAEGKLMTARVPLAECQVRGLAPLEPKGVLRYGKISKYFFDLALNEMLKTPSQERYIAVTFSGGYHLQVPEQKVSDASVEYAVADNILLDLHSHGTMGAFFSTQDAEDEQGLKVYGVVGKLGSTPVVKLRVGVYGYFHSIAWGDVFDGSLTGAVESEEDGQEVVRTDELHDIPKEHDAKFQNHRRGLWWDWWLRK